MGLRGDPVRVRADPFQYRRLNTDRDRGNSATVGIENAAGTDALQFSFNAASLANGQAILFKHLPAGPF